MTRRPAGRVLLAAALLALPVALAGWGPLYNETDGQYAAAATTMAASGNWLVPENNGVPRLVKPPLLVWMMAGAMKIFGPSDFAARLPGALAVTITAALVFLIGRLWGGRGFLAAGIWLTMLGAFTLSRIVMPEPVFTAFITAAIASFLLAGRASGRARAAWLLAFWVCGGLAAFAKGPHGLLYPLAAAAASILACRDRSLGRAMAVCALPGVLLAAAINLPWHLAIEARFPGYLHNLFFAEHIGHLAGSEAPATGRGDVPRLSFVLLQLVWFLPWAAALAGVRRPAIPQRPWSLEAICVVWWAGLVVGSVLLAGQRQDYYAMPAWPALALLLARALDGVHWRRAAFAAASCLGIALAATLAAVFLATGTAPLAARDTALTTVLQFGAGVWRELAVVALLGLAPAIVLLVALRDKAAAMTAAGACLGMAAVAGTTVVAPYFSMAPIAPAIVAAAGPDGLVVFDGDIDTGSSLLHYTNRRIHLLDATPDFVTRTTGIGQANYLTRQQFLELWHSPQTVILVTDQSTLPSETSHHIASSGTTTAISNHPPAASKP